MIRSKTNCNHAIETISENRRKRETKHPLLLILLIFFLWSNTNSLWAKTRKEFEQERRVLIERIAVIKKSLESLSEQKQVSMGKLNILTMQVESTEQLIKSVEQELTFTEHDIAKKEVSIATLDQSLKQLKHEYGILVYEGEKAHQYLNSSTYYFASQSFNQLFQRFQYLKQYRAVRKHHLREIEKKEKALKIQKQFIEKKKQEKSDLLSTHQKGLLNLKELKAEEKQAIISLNKEKKKQEKKLSQQNKDVRRLDRLIKETIRKAVEAQKKREAARKAAQRKTRSRRSRRSQRKVEAPYEAPNAASKRPLNKKEQRLLTSSFRKKRNQLRWPVREGFVSRRFGMLPHKVFKQIKIENHGIDIQTKRGYKALAVFDGIVKMIARVPGMQHIVIVQHGQYYTAYARLGQPTVKKGQHVRTGEIIGPVHTRSDGITELQFQVWQKTTKLNPIHWIKKK